jgi:hypothetical protein
MSFLDSTNANYALASSPFGTITPTYGSLAASGPNVEGNTIVAGDFNGDGLADIVVNDWNTPQNIYIYLSNGDGTFSLSQTITTPGDYGE